jgi:NADPH:quinone reductase-like Zn-dependent oxidoreductase
LNAGDWHTLRGEPYFIRPAATGMGRPTRPGLGMDYAGTVEAVGKNVTQFRPGDEVFGGRGGALTEYLSVVAERSISAKPANMTLEQAAAVPVAAITALQALRDHGRLAAGQKVLINGASGGVGTFAVQIAKAFGAEVTGVCSTRNLALVRELGADHVVDYTREDFTRGAQQYDLIVDLVDNHSPLDYARVLKPDGVVVIVGSASKDPWIGAFSAILKPTLYGPFVSQELVFFIARMNKQDLAVLTELIEAGKVKAVIDRTYGVDETRDALRYLEEGHVRGKVIVTFPERTNG